MNAVEAICALIFLAAAITVVCYAIKFARWLAAWMRVNHPRRNRLKRGHLRAPDKRCVVGESWRAHNQTGRFW